MNDFMVIDEISAKVEEVKTIVTRTITSGQKTINTTRLIDDGYMNYVKVVDLKNILLANSEAGDCVYINVLSSTSGLNFSIKVILNGQTIMSGATVIWGVSKNIYIPTKMKISNLEIYIKKGNMDGEAKISLPKEFMYFDYQ